MNGCVNIIIFLFGEMITHKSLFRRRLFEVSKSLFGMRSELFAQISSKMETSIGLMPTKNAVEPWLMQFSYFNSRILKWTSRQEFIRVNRDYQYIKDKFLGVSFPLENQMLKTKHVSFTYIHISESSSVSQYLLKTSVVLEINVNEEKFFY